MIESGKKWLGRLPYWLYLALCATVASAVIIYFYSPRFVLWQGLGIPPALYHPELNRADDALKQLANPFTSDFRPTNGIIRWRLLFPLLGHYLYLSDTFYLSLPFIGVALVLAYAAHLGCRETKDRLIGILFAIAAGTTSWFFVSTGWLAYFDSWYILGLLVVAFSPSHRLLATACLLAPWVDERFALALPVALAVRRFYFANERSYSWDKWLRDVLRISLYTLPFLVLRAIIIFHGSDSSESVTKFGHPLESPTFWWHLLLGLWHSIRGLWFFVGLALWILYSRYYRIAAIAIVIITTAIYTVCICIAGDVSRSLSMFLPLPIFGIILAYRHERARATVMLGAVVAFNLIAPASHVMTSFDEPIFDLRYESAHFDTPPMDINPIAYNNEAVNLIEQKKIDDGLRLLGWALQLKPDYGRAYFNRGYALGLKGDLQNAMTDLTFAIRHDPTFPDSYYFRGIAYMGLNNPASAAPDLAYALRIAPADWKYRADAEKRLQLCSPH